MKLQSLSLIFVLGVVEFGRMVHGLCLVRNKPPSEVYWYHCFQSNNHLADVQTAPIDIPKITFSNSQIQVIKNRSFSRLGNYLETLEIVFCETREIEDNAFEGLAKLHSLEIAENNLQVVKGVWFKGLSNLKTISFRNNKIKRVENSFYSIVPPLETLDISGNELECFHMHQIGTFKTKTLRFRFNPVSWGCVASLIDWLDKAGIEYDEFGRGHWDPSSEFVLFCEEKIGKPLNQISEEEIKKCAEKTVSELLPPQENYTVNEVCKFLKGRPSPFLICP